VGTPGASETGTYRPAREVLASTGCAGYLSVWLFDFAGGGILGVVRQAQATARFQNVAVPCCRRLTLVHWTHGQPLSRWAPRKRGCRQTSRSIPSTSANKTSTFWVDGSPAAACLGDEALYLHAKGPISTTWGHSAARPVALLAAPWRMRQEFGCIFLRWRMVITSAIAQVVLIPYASEPLASALVLLKHGER